MVWLHPAGTSLGEVPLPKPRNLQHEAGEMGCWCVWEVLFTAIQTLKAHDFFGHAKDFLQHSALLPVVLEVLGHLVYLGPQVIPAKSEEEVKELKKTVPFFS